MTLALRFAVVSDLHIGLPHTIGDHPTRFHLVEVSIPAFEQVLSQLAQMDLDFLLLPGDLTQHGEPENHAWLSRRLATLPFPVYVIPGNHDVPVPLADGTSIGWEEFPSYYRHCGYGLEQALYYSASPAPGVRLIALNSNQFNAEGVQMGCLDEQQLHWLADTLNQTQNELVLVMVHHNVLEHFPHQTQHPIGRRYMLQNAPTLLKMLQAAKVQLVLTGHLHVQDIAHQESVFDITTGSLVSYPHPYRVVHLRENEGQIKLSVTSPRVESLTDWPNLQQFSREWMGDRSLPFMTYMLTQPPLNLSPKAASAAAPRLRYFWSTIANGDPEFEYPDLPDALQQHFEHYSHRHSEEVKLGLSDNRLDLTLTHPL